MFGLNAAVYCARNVCVWSRSVPLFDTALVVVSDRATPAAFEFSAVFLLPL